MRLQRIEQVLFILSVLFLPTQLGKHFWFDFSFIFSIPIDYLSPVIYFWDILIFLLFLSWTLQKPKINPLSLFLCLIFMLSQTLSLLFAESVGAGLTKLYFYLPPLLFLVYLSSVKLTNLLKFLFVPLLIVLTSESLLAIVEVFIGSDLGLWILGERDFNLTTPFIATYNFFGKLLLRPYATFPHPNVLAAHLVLGLMLLQIFKKVSLTAASLKFKKITIVLSLFALLLTFSRTALIGLMAVWVFANRSKIKSAMKLSRVKKFILENEFDPRAAVVFALFSLILIPVLLTRFLSILNYDQISFIRRSQLSKIAIDTIRENPLFGIGLNNFILRLSQSQLISGEQRFLQPVHSVVLLSLSETGIIGLTGLVLLFVFFLEHALQKHEQLKTPLLIALLMTIFLGLFDHYFITLPQGFRMIALIGGLSLNPNYPKTAKI